MEEMFVCIPSTSTDSTDVDIRTSPLGDSTKIHLSDSESEFVRHVLDSAVFWDIVRKYAQAGFHLASEFRSK